MTAPPTSTVTLRPLRDDEFDAWRNESAAGFGADLARAADLGADEAARQAREAFDRLFPSGLRSPDQLVCRARDIDRLELNVFGGNDAAIGLYTSLGYAVTSQQMRKHL